MTPAERAVPANVRDHPERLKAACRGDLASELITVACELACLVRESDRDAIGEFLASLTDEQARALPVVAAAMIDVNRPVAELLSWVTWDEFGQPLPGPRKRGPVPVYGCGTYAAWRRHKRNGEPVDKCGCGDAEKEYRAVRRRARRRPQTGKDLAA